MEPYIKTPPLPYNYTFNFPMFIGPVKNCSNLTCSDCYISIEGSSSRSKTYSVGVKFLLNSSPAISTRAEFDTNGRNIDSSRIPQKNTLNTCSISLNNKKIYTNLTRTEAYFTGVFNKISFSIPNDNEDVVQISLSQKYCQDEVILKVNISQDPLQIENLKIQNEPTYWIQG